MLKINKKWLTLAFFLVSGCAVSNSIHSSVNSDLCQVIDKVINLDKLQQYYHVDAIPKRKPLIIVLDKYNSQCVNLEKFGELIVFHTKIESKDMVIPHYIEILKMEIGKDMANVGFIYKTEGIKVNVKLKKISSKWKVYESTLVER